MSLTVAKLVEQAGVRPDTVRYCELARLLPGPDTGCTGNRSGIDSSSSKANDPRAPADREVIKTCGVELIAGLVCEKARAFDLCRHRLGVPGLRGLAPLLLLQWAGIAFSIHSFEHSQPEAALRTIWFRAVLVAASTGRALPYAARGRMHRPCDMSAGKHEPRRKR